MRVFRPAVPSALSGTLAVLRLLPEVSVPLTVLLFWSILIAALLPLAFTIAAGVLVGSIPAAVKHGFSSSAGDRTLLLLGIAATLVLTQHILAPFVGALATVFGRKVDAQLQERVMLAVGRPAGIRHLEDPAVLDQIKSTQSIGAEGFHPGDAVASLAGLLPSWFQALGSAVILATFRWWLGLIWIALWPVVLYFLQREYIRVGQAAMGEAEVVRRADYYRDLALTPGAAKEVRVWGLPDWVVSRFETSWREAMSPIWQARRPGRLVVWASTLTVTAANLGTFALLAWAASRGDVSLAALAVYTRAAIDTATFRAFDDQNMVLAYATVAVPALLALERQAEHGDRAGTQAISDSSPTEGIHFERVGFRYPGGAAEFLTELDLALPAGRSLAIVGANGAGKTTLVKLLCRMYEPTQGRIVVDGISLADVSPSEWRSHVAAIFQDFTQYHLSARDNVAMGAPKIADDLERLRDASRRAGALELIESLPLGWETILSRQYSGGMDLSGGQWQRIALARALFAVEAGARVLVLDEPTANLDVRAEAEIYDRFLELTAGLTTILISHRFSTVRRADHIVVLAGGRIVERGAHDELMALDGDYAHMFRLQAQRFTAGV